MKVGILGSGQVGQVLAKGFVALGHDVTIGTRDIARLKSFSEESGVALASTVDATEKAEIVVLAVRGDAAEALCKELAAHLAGKTIIDTTNPIAGAAVGGILPYFTNNNESLIERLQKAVPEAHFVKAFSCVGSGFMIKPQLPGGPPTMFIGGDDNSAKEQVTGLLKQWGWDVEDVGGAIAGRAIEPLCQLWCAPGFSKNRWSHAFKMLRT